MAKEKFIIQWHITHTCNLRCSHCYQDDYKNNLTQCEINKILDRIKAFIEKHNYRLHINITGGEPFTHPNIYELLDKLETSNITFGILTNGTLLDNKAVKKLKQYKCLKFIQLSLDGTKEVHDNIRGTGNYEKVKKAIKLLNKHKIESMISFTCSTDNYKSLKTVIRECEKMHVKRFWMDRLVPIGRNKEKVLNTEQFLETLETLKQESIRAENNIFIKTKIHTNRAMQFMCGCDNSRYECSAGKNLLTILADGTLLPCRRLPIELGNVLDKDIDEILNESKNNWLKQDSISEDCKTCKFKRQCQGGAKCLTYAMTGKIKEKDINCIIK